MRVLMLGWEFPPRVSGGLGTACEGIVRGLTHHGVEVLLVVPHASDETRAGEAVSDVADVLRADSAPPLAGVGSQSPVARSFELLSLDSPLRPYQSRSDYSQRLTSALADRRRRHDRERGSGGGGSYHPKDVSPPAWARRFVGSAPTRDEWKAVRRGQQGQPYASDLRGEVERYAREVAHLARTREFDLIHAHDWMTWPAGLFAKEISGKPLICHVHACEHDRNADRGDRTIRAIEQLGIDGADRTVCVSRFAAEVLGRHYRVDASKVRIVHNGVTRGPALRNRRKDGLGLPLGGPVVLYLGRMTLQKGPDYFLEAAALVLRHEPHAQFVMAGDGELREHLVERAAELGIARNVHFTGFLAGDERESVFALADCFVMPSVSEPFGIAALEAMTRDVPVVLSRQSGAAEAMRSSLKVDFWNVDELAHKVLSVLRHPALGRQLVEEGRSELERMSWEQRTRPLLDVYGELVA